MKFRIVDKKTNETYVDAGGVELSENNIEFSEHLGLKEPKIVIHKSNNRKGDSYSYTEWTFILRKNGNWSEQDTILVPVDQEAQALMENLVAKRDEAYASDAAEEARIEALPVQYEVYTKSKGMLKTHKRIEVQRDSVGHITTPDSEVFRLSREGWVKRGNNSIRLRAITPEAQSVLAEEEKRVSRFENLKNKRGEFFTIADRNIFDHYGREKLLAALARAYGKDYTHCSDSWITMMVREEELLPTPGKKQVEEKTKPAHKGKKGFWRSLLGF